MVAEQPFPAGYFVTLGGQFEGETFDTGVCHMALFADPDGNALMLHSRYVPYEDKEGAS